MRLKKFIQYIAFSSVLSFSCVCCEHAWAEEPGASWLRTKTFANALNPNISVIGDFTANTGPLTDPAANRLSLRETEVTFQASVDPYARADFFVAFPEGEAVELEEGYISLLSLPWGIKARGGKFLPSFGRLNMVHTHELAQVDRPLALQSFLGEEGLNDTGAEISRIFAPFGLFTEISYAFLNGLGEEAEPAEVTTQVVDANLNVTTVTVKQDPAPTRRKIQNFAHVSRIRFYQDITDSSNIELGFSGAIHEPKEGKKQTKLGAIDLTFRWKPVQEGLYRSFIWRSELLYSRRRLPQEVNILTGAITAMERELHRRGAYSYIEIQPAQRWRFGVRGDYVEDPEALAFETSITRAVSPYITFALSEFNRFRLQYQHRNVPQASEDEHRVFFQWTVVLGPHGAHPF